MISPKTSLTPDDLAHIPIQKPEGAGESWVGIGHYELLQGLRLSMPIRKEVMTAGVSHDQKDVAITYGIFTRSPPPLPGNWTYCIGVINSNARRIALRAFVGVQSTDTRLGLPLEELKLGSGGGKHGASRGAKKYAGFSLQATLETIREMADMLLKAHLPRQIGILTKARCDSSRAANLLGRAGMEGIMPWSRLGKVGKIFEGSVGETEWDLLLSFALLAREGPVIHQMPTVLEFRGLLSK